MGNGFNQPYDSGSNIFIESAAGESPTNRTGQISLQVTKRTEAQWSLHTIGAPGGG